MRRFSLAGAARGDVSFQITTGTVASVPVAVVVGIGLVLWDHSRLSLHAFGLRFWTLQEWNPVTREFGALPFIWGTLYSSMLAFAIATPIAISIAAFLNEFCPRQLRPPLIFLTELLAAIPSLVYGMWGVFVLVPRVRAFELALPLSLRATPLFSGPPVGIGVLSAAIVLAVMIVPFTSAVAREILAAVPATQRHAALALGATRWEATRVVLHQGRTGLIGASLLGLGRALGETMAVTMLIGNAARITVSMFAPQHTMAAVIANEFGEASEPLYLSALVQIGLGLFLLTLVINLGSRLLIWSMTRQRRPRPRAVREAVEAEA
jgi:phosphate transport system permease protein